MDYTFKNANKGNLPQIWAIIQQAISRRKEDGSNQWQDGYPNEELINQDIEKEIAYVLVQDTTLVGYIAIIFNDEPAYENIEGSWLTHGDFAVVHRLAISDRHLGKGLAQKLLNHAEQLAKKKNIFSVKIDTNFDNIAMLAILEKMGYIYCGEVTFRNGNHRKAFEKILG